MQAWLMQPHMQTKRVTHAGQHCAGLAWPCTPDQPGYSSGPCTPQQTVCTTTDPLIQGWTLGKPLLILACCCVLPLQTLRLRKAQVGQPHWVQAAPGAMPAARYPSRLQGCLPNPSCCLLCQVRRLPHCLPAEQLYCATLYCAAAVLPGLSRRLLACWV